MKKISIAVPATYSMRDGGRRYIPVVKALKSNISHCYGIGFPRGYEPDKELPLENMVLYKLPNYVSYLVKKIASIIKIPKYYVYWSRVKTLDYLISKKIKKDTCDIVLINPVLTRSAKQAKSMGKFVIVEAGNSEPYREYSKCSEDYTIYGIKNRYIYGDRRFEDGVRASLQIADRIISISKVSMQTYIEAGYSQNMIELIPLTGTDFKINMEVDNSGKKKAFISTAFHNFVKGTHRLLLAWKKANIKEIPLILVGNLCDDMEEFIEKYGPFENVIFAGHQSNLREWYKNYDAVGILLSLSEGAGRTTPEMMSFGFPMIVSEDATCDLVMNGYNGFIVDPTHEEEIVEKLLLFVNNWEETIERKNVLNSVNVRTLDDYSNELSSYLGTYL